MPVIKLDATTSTNDFLKKLAVNQLLENFTVVTAQKQTQGRGQMGAKWNSEPGKNLIMSVLVKNAVSEISNLYDLNICTSLAVFHALSLYDIPRLSIKWPNDIMSGNKKIAGILIENLIKSDGEIISISGIGINVNQKDFSELPNAASLSIILNRELDREIILDDIVEGLKNNTNKLADSKETLWEAYNSVLFRRDIPTAFQSANGSQFMGIITHVAQDGRLCLKDENQQELTFDIKEIKMLY